MPTSGPKRQFAFTKIIVNDLDAESSFHSSVIGLIETHRVTGGEGDGAYAESVMRSPDSDGPSLLLVKHLHREAPPPGEGRRTQVDPPVPLADRPGHRP